MNKKIPSKSVDLKQLLSEKLAIYYTLFSAPIPSVPEKDTDPLFHYQRLSELFHSKGKKLIEITSTYQQLSDTYFKNMKYLESYKESSEYKIEKLEIHIEQTENSLKSQKKTIDNLNSYIEDVEKHLLEASKQRDEYKKSLQSTKKDLKDLEKRLEKTITQNQVLDLKRHEEDLKKLEIFKCEVLSKERLIEDLRNSLFKSEKNCEKEKEISEKFRSNCEKLRSEIFELKNKLSEEKLKKSNYKDLYKEIIEERSAKSRNFSVKTIDEENSEENFDIEPENDLLVLEQEFSISSSLDLRESCILTSQSDNIFYLVSKSSSLNIEKTSQQEIKPKAKTLSISQYQISIESPSISKAVLYTVPASSIKKNSNVCIKTKTLENGSEILQIRQAKQILSAPVSPTSQVVKVKDWDRKTETPVIEVSHDSEEAAPETTSKKGYIASFCQGFRSSIIKPAALINRFSKLKELSLPEGFPGIVSNSLRRINK